MSAQGKEPEKRPPSPPAAKAAPATGAPAPKRHTDAHVPIKPPKPGQPIPKSPPSASRQPTGLTQLTAALKGNQSGIAPHAASGLQPRVSGIIPKARTSVMPAKTSAPVSSASPQFPAAKQGLNQAARSVHDPRSNTGFVPAIKHPPPNSRGKHISALTHAIQLNCRSCGKSILDAGPDSKVEKAGAGFICVECVAARKTRAAARGRVLRGGAAAAVAGLIVFAIILPGQASLSLATAGVLLALTGLLAHDTRRIWRYAMLSLGIAAISGGVYGMTIVSERAQRDLAHSGLLEESRAIRELLEKSHFAEAQGRFRTLSADIAAGKFNADAAFAEQTATEGRRQLDEWLKTRFGSTSEEERVLALALLAKYPDSASSKGPKIQGVTLQNNAATVRAAMSSEATTPTEARSLLLFLFETYPRLEKIRLETGSAVYENTRDLVSQLRYGGLPQKVSVP